eukprot:TRINITY_DN4558_c1_g1_i1.p1 TRINITY_DN4558_c1_g1~~TRINITY_DN4558_c1_g1_i1.p1  ORF type:complete len:298 (+),score=84.92 TRINITY_DN4558_c1_g1_i1:192-1085(+)
MSIPNENEDELEELPIVDELFLSIGNDEELKGILKSKIKDVNICDENKVYGIHLASLLGFYGSIELLIQHNADVNVKDGEDKTPLHFSASFDDSEKAFSCTELLLNNNAKINLTDKEHKIALHYAANNPSGFKAAKLLLDKGEDPHAKDKAGLSTLHLCCSNDNHQLLEHLLELDVDIECIDEKKRTPLHFACFFNKTKCIEKLIEKGANIETVDANEELPLHCLWYGAQNLLSNAKESEIQIILDDCVYIENLLKADEYIDFANKDGFTPNDIKEIVLDEFIKDEVEENSNNNEDD